MKQVILDTNFLLVPIQEKVDVFSELDRVIDDLYDVFVVEKTLDELEVLLGKVKYKDQVAVKVAKQLIKHQKIKVLKTK